MFPVHTLDLRVYYEDTDALGIVYHANYLRFAERGRTEMLRTAGFEHALLLAETGLAFVIKKISVDYLAPARLDELLTVKTRVTEVKGASMQMAQEICRAGVSLVTLDMTVACLDQAGKAARLPLKVRDIFK